MTAHFLNELFLAGNNASLGTTKEFVSTEYDERNASFDAFANGWLVNSKRRQIKHAAGAEVLDKREIGFLAECNEFGEIGLIRKPTHLKVRRMHAHQGSSLFVDHLRVIFNL